MRGRKPTPTALHRLRGTFNTTRHGKGRTGEPDAPGDLLAEPPTWMTDGQQDAWRYAVEHAPAGVLRRIDRGVLAVWVEAEDRHRAASMALARENAASSTPYVVEGRGGPIPSPLVAVVQRAAQTMLKAASELGFSPAARPRLALGGGGDAAPDDPWDKLGDRLRVIAGGKAQG